MEALEFTLALASFEQKITLFFQGKGIYQLLSNQSPHLIKLKPFTKAYKALELYDIHNIYVDQSSMDKLCLDHKELIIPVTIIKKTTFRNLIVSHDIIFKF